MNNKSRIALAIAAAFGAATMGVSSSAVAQTSTVQMGGGFNMFYQNSKPGGGAITSTVPQGKSHDNLSLSEPEMWIHGEEKIGAMTTWFRCTSSFDLMGTGSMSTTGAGQFCGRNSALGFKGNFGNLFFGMWDTPHKDVAAQVRGWWGGTASLTGGFANVLYDGSGNIGNAGGQFANNGSTTVGSSTFYDRRARSINYHSPSMSGFTVKGQFSAANEHTNLTTITLGTLAPRSISAAVEYTNGPAYVGLGYENHKDYNPGSVAAANIGETALTQYGGGTDTAWTIGGRYTLATNTRLSGLWTTQNYDVANGSQVKKRGWAVFVDHTISGPHAIKGQYFKTGDLKSNLAATPDTGAKGWSVAYTYQFSKRTEASLVYGLIDNELNADYGKGASTAQAGATQKNYGLNIRHKF